jgi:transposase
MTGRTSRLGSFNAVRRRRQRSPRSTSRRAAAFPERAARRAHIVTGGKAGKRSLLGLGRPLPVRILDNLSPHKAPRVRALIERAGCRLLFLPPYSPDFNPIEPAWSKLKALLRGLGARTTEALHAALTPLVDAITTSDARGYFRHCGYVGQ